MVKQWQSNCLLGKERFVVAAHRAERDDTVFHIAPTAFQFRAVRVFISVSVFISRPQAAPSLASRLHLFIFPPFPCFQFRPCEPFDGTVETVPYGAPISRGARHNKNAPLPYNPLYGNRMAIVWQSFAHCQGGLYAYSLPRRGLRRNKNRPCRL